MFGILGERKGRGNHEMKFGDLVKAYEVKLPLRSILGHNERQ